MKGHCSGVIRAEREHFGEPIGDNAQKGAVAGHSQLVPLEWHIYPIEFNSMVVLEPVLLSVIAAAAHIATTKTATTAPGLCSK